MFGFEQRSSRRWASGKRAVPYFLAIMLRMLISGTIDADDVERHRCRGHGRSRSRTVKRLVGGKWRARRRSLSTWTGMINC
jgi:hypothetical protein